MCIWAAPCQNVSLALWGQQRPRSASASAQSEDLHCPQTETLDTIACFEESTWLDKTWQDDVNTHIFCTFKGTFSSFDVANICFPVCFIWDHKFSCTGNRIYFRL